MVVVTALGAAALVLLLVSDRRGGTLHRPAKVATSICFIAVVLIAGALDTGYGQWVLIALLLSAVGDTALLGSSSSMFLLGLGSFLLAHLAYVVAFVVRGVDAAPTAIAAGGLVVPIVVVIRWLWPHVPAAMQRPVGAYAVIISLMVAGAVGTVAAEGDARILVAAVAFYVSDLAVARNRFVAPGFDNRLWGLPLYYVGQFLFAWSVAI